MHHLPNVPKKIDGTTMDGAKDLELVIQVYNIILFIIEYSLNYSEITGTLWFYLTDEATNFNENRY